MKKLQREQNFTYLFIAHDLSMVKYISDRIAVMHHGKIVELGPAAEIYSNPVHPYTQSFLSAVPQPDPISESKRVRVSYTPEEVTGELEQFEVSPEHFVYGTKEQVTRWTN